MAATGVPQACQPQSAGLGWSRQTEIGCGRVTWACVAMECVSHFLVEPLPSQTRVPFVASGPPAIFVKTARDQR